MINHGNYFIATNQYEDNYGDLYLMQNHQDMDKIATAVGGVTLKKNQYIQSWIVNEFVCDFCLNKNPMLYKFRYCPSCGKNVHRFAMDNKNPAFKSTYIGDAEPHDFLQKFLGIKTLTDNIQIVYVFASKMGGVATHYDILFYDLYHAEYHRIYDIRMTKGDYVSYVVELSQINQFHEGTTEILTSAIKSHIDYIKDIRNEK